MSEFVADLKKIKERARAHMGKGALTRVTRPTSKLRSGCSTTCWRLKSCASCAISVIILWRQGSIPMAPKPNSCSMRLRSSSTRTGSRGASRSSTARPIFNPEELASRSHSEYAEGTGLTSMLKEDLFAARLRLNPIRKLPAGSAMTTRPSGR